MKSLNINGTEYPVHCGYGTIVLLGERTGLDFWEILDKFQNPDKKGANDLFTFLADFTVCLIERSGGDLKLSKYEVIDWLAEGNTQQVLDLFLESAPKLKNPEAPVKGQKEQK